MKRCDALKRLDAPMLTLASLHTSCSLACAPTGRPSGRTPSETNFSRNGRGCKRLKRAGVKLDAAAAVAVAIVKKSSEMVRKRVSLLISGLASYRSELLLAARSASSEDRARRHKDRLDLACETSAFPHPFPAFPPRPPPHLSRKDARSSPPRRAPRGYLQARRRRTARGIVAKRVEGVFPRLEALSARARQL